MFDSIAASAVPVSGLSGQHPLGHLDRVGQIEARARTAAVMAREPGLTHKQAVALARDGYKVYLVLSPDHLWIKVGIAATTIDPAGLRTVVWERDGWTVLFLWTAQDEAVARDAERAVLRSWRSRGLPTGDRGTFPDGWRECAPAGSVDLDDADLIVTSVIAASDLPMPTRVPPSCRIRRLTS